jgi:excisionase family DNA binding protein
VYALRREREAQDGGRGDVTADEFLRVLVRQEVERALREQAKPPPSDWLSTDEAAELVGVRPKTVRSWVAAGMPATRRGRRLVIARRVLEAYRSGATPEAAQMLSGLTGAAK